MPYSGRWIEKAGIKTTGGIDCEFCPFPLAILAVLTSIPFHLRTSTPPSCSYYHHSQREHHDNFSLYASNVRHEGRKCSFDEEQNPFSSIE